MNYRKVYGGTPVGEESRCDTCSRSRVIKGYSESERIVICDRFWKPLFVPFKVAECSEYFDKRLPDFEDLEEIALDVTKERVRKVSGFVVGTTEDEDEVEQTARSG